MNAAVVIALRDLKSAFNAPVAYIVVIAFSVLSSFLYFQGFFIQNEADMRSWFSALPWLFMVFIPAVTMKSIADEKKTHTLELLLSWPVRDSAVVAGKFGASFALVVIAISLSSTIPITLGILGSPDFGIIISGYAGALLLAAAITAIGIFSSSITDNQIFSFLFGTALCFMLVIIGSPVVTTFAPPALVPLLRGIGLEPHFEPTIRGVIDSRDVVYFLSVTALFLCATIVSFHRRRFA